MSREDDGLARKKGEKTEQGEKTEWSWLLARAGGVDPKCEQQGDVIARRAGRSGEADKRKLASIQVRAAGRETRT